MTRLSFEFWVRISRHLDHPWSTWVIVHSHMFHPMELSPPETLYRSELSTHCARGCRSWSTDIPTVDWMAGHPHVAGHQVGRSCPCTLTSHLSSLIITRERTILWSGANNVKILVNRVMSGASTCSRCVRSVQRIKSSPYWNWCFTGNLQ